MSMAKSISAIVCAVLMTISFTSCQKTTFRDKEVKAPRTKSTEAPGQYTVPDTESAGMEGSGEDGGRVLVAYFSCTGNTGRLAGYAAEITGGTLYEIVPAEPYTSADLDYGDSGSRTSIEQNDKSCRPEIQGSVENFDEYETVFLAYPIWWGEAPRIISTFVESYDFSGKTVVPFCTSGSSGIGNSAKNLHSLTSGANWLDGARHNSSMTKDEMEKWINGLGIDYQ